MQKRITPRSLGLWLGQMPVGSHNDITDVPGVMVGNISLIKGGGPLVPSGGGPVRTGVTAIIPRMENLYRQPCCAGIDVINGYGKSLGVPFIQEMGILNSPILLTNTLSVNDVANGVITYLLRQNPEIGNDARTPNIVVFECDDSYLNDIRGRHVKPWDAMFAIQHATNGPIEQGNVGAGVGMSCFQMKGGIGSSSRLVSQRGHTYVVGMLVLANFGLLRDFLLSGVPVGQYLTIREAEYTPGSLILVGITDAPLSRWQLKQLARRSVLGIARTGSISMTGSGDFSLMVSTYSGELNDYLSDWDLDDFFRAVVEASAESIWNALFLAQSMDGRDGHIRYALPIEQTLKIIRNWHGGQGPA
ncbi:MAG: P1 family peptidase [Bacillota bacterium]|nr:P1 family peptidase [Bacillota bacterium]